ncbi:MAG: hypothetical protein IJS58_07475 [Bacilli bacterium]|nr:hypothetical protein [Bacilli bacterium]
MIKVDNYKQALFLLKTHILVSIKKGEAPLFFILTKDKANNELIMVTNDTRKYYISIDDYKFNFYNDNTYIYKSIEELSMNNLDEKDREKEIENQIIQDRENHMIRQ